ncbi:MAG TPA: hypothetical protein V6C91_00440, partial [Coleofasciculaceae cyanobacterium]
MLGRITRNCFRSQSFWKHPDWLPTFAPVLLGLLLFVLGWGALDGWTLLQLLALALLTVCTLLPLSTVRVAFLVQEGRRQEAESTREESWYSKLSNLFERVDYFRP